MNIRVQIGAPRGSPARNSGSIFRCNIKEKCEVLDIYPENTSRRLKDKQFNAWIGSTMDISLESERVVVCAHRWIDHIKKIDPANDHYFTKGACFSSHVNDTTIHDLVPFNDNAKAFTHDRKYYYFGQGQTGFSAHFTNSKAVTELLIGAPGVLNWIGTTLIYTDETTRTGSRMFGHLNIAESNVRPNSGFGLVGYAVTSGYFFKKNELLHVTGAPRTMEYLGQIMVYSLSPWNERIHLKDIKMGSQLGEYFGASLAAGDTNNDGYDDLVVGAPFHSSGKFNEGRVYIYFGNPKGILNEPGIGHVINGGEAGGQFGTSVMFLSDLDLDGFGEIAVAAPYESDNAGVVYIYRAFPQGIMPTPSQRIVGKEIWSSIRGFGISISKARDVDHNKYADVAIGAYLSGHTVLLRSRPVVIITHTLEPYIRSISYETNTFTVKACFMCKGRHLEPLINITRIIVVDKLLQRAVLSENILPVKKISLMANKFTCENITLDIKHPVENFAVPITVSLSHTFLEKNNHTSTTFIGTDVNGTDNFCSNCPVYNEKESSKKYTLNIPMSLGCKHKSVCVAKLHIEASFNITNGTFVVGSANSVSMMVLVRNEGEKAYMTQLKFNMPDGIYLKSVPAFCVEQQASEVICNVENPLLENKEKIITLDYEMEEINNGKYDKSHLDFKITALTSSKNKKENFKNVTLLLKYEADISITGKSGEQSYSLEDNNLGYRNFTQIYQVERIGPSPISEANIVIIIPVGILSAEGPLYFIHVHPPEVCSVDLKHRHLLIDADEDNFNVRFSNQQRQKRNARENEHHNKMDISSEFRKLVNQTLYINCTNGNYLCIPINCSCGPFAKGRSSTLFQFEMTLNTSVLSVYLAQKDVVMFSTEGSVSTIDQINLLGGNEWNDIAEISTVFIGDARSVKINLWIIVVSAVAGLLLLYLIAFALFKAGFFKRTKKIELDALKNAKDSQSDVDVTNSIF